MGRASASLTNQCGAALPIVMIFAVITLATVLAVVQLGAQDAALALRDVRTAEAFYLAESGLERARSWLEAQDCPPEGSSEFYPWGDDPEHLGSGLYTVRILPDPGNGGSTPSIYTLTSTAAVGGHTRTVQRVMMAQSLGHFLYFTDREHMQGSGNPVWFVTPDLLDGPLHTNDQIHILGDPTFLGYVRSAYGGPDDHPNHVPSFEYYNGNYFNHVELDAPSNPPHDAPTFGEGYELGTSEIGLPTSSIADFAAAAKEGGIYVKGSREVAFARPDQHGNPMHGYVSYRKNPRKPWTDVEIAETNGIMYVKGQAKLLGGTLDGRLTVASNTLMKIEDDIVYRASDECGPLPGCDDMLGLVCKGDIVVSDNAANRDGCVIHAHIVATHTSLKAEHWANRRPSGMLTVHGGICQRFRGPMGTAYLDGDELVILTGFHKDYRYDRRLLGMSPPGYKDILNTGLYVSLGWREVGPG